MALRRVGGWCEMAASLEWVSWSNEFVARQMPASKDMNTDAEEAMALGTITSWQQTFVHAVVYCSVHDLAFAL
jgi:hypothetical protein